MQILLLTILLYKLGSYNNVIMNIWISLSSLIITGFYEVCWQAQMIIQAMIAEPFSSENSTPYLAVNI